jgi:hypothetical protein
MAINIKARGFLLLVSDRLNIPKRKVCTSLADGFGLSLGMVTNHDHSGKEDGHLQEIKFTIYMTDISLMKKLGIYAETCSPALRDLFKNLL